MTYPGHENWCTRDYGGEGKAVSLSKRDLGEFFFHLLRFGGTIYQSYAMAKSPRAYCQFAITLPKGRKEDFERASGFTLEKIPEVKLS